MLIRKVDFQRICHIKDVTLINEPISHHFGHFIENDLYALRFNLFDSFDKGQELKLICNDQNVTLVDKVSQHLQFNHSKVVLTPHTEVSFTNLYVTNKVRLLPHSYRNFHIVYNWRALEPLGDLNNPFLKFNNVVKSDSELKIALLRRQAAWRRLENLSDVLAILDKFNFRTIDPESLSIQELYQLISMSSHIITEWGSIESNFNLIPIRNKVVIQLCPSNAENQSRAYPGLLSFNNKVHVLYGKSHSRERQSNWKIDIKSLDNFLSGAFSRRIIQ
jgi:capsular polysaccharide biosynthesis protein